MDHKHICKECVWYELCQLKWHDRRIAYDEPCEEFEWKKKGLEDEG